MGAQAVGNVFGYLRECDPEFHAKIKHAHVDYEFKENRSQRVDREETTRLDFMKWVGTMTCETVNERMERIATLLLEFVVIKNRVPKFREEYKGENIGKFWSSIKQKGPTHQTYISTLSSNGILRSNMEVTNKKSSHEEKATLLLEFVVIKNRVPKSREEYKGENIGLLWRDIKCKGPTHQTYISTLASNDILRSNMQAKYGDEESGDGEDHVERDSP